VIDLNNKIIKKITFVCLTSLLFLVGCGTTEKKVEKEEPVEIAKEEEKEVKNEKEDTLKNEPKEEVTEVVKEEENKETNEEDIKNLINFAKDGIITLDNHKTTFNYAKYDNIDQMNFYNESTVEKRVVMNNSKEALVTNTVFNEGVKESYTVLFGDGKTYKKDSAGTVTTEPNDGFGSSEEFFMFTEGLNEHLGFIYETLENVEYNVEDVILKENKNNFVLTFDAEDKTINKMYHFEIKVNSYNRLEKLTMSFEDEGKTILTLEKQIIDTIKHDFY
jgi:hypothetical protein